MKTTMFPPFRRALLRALLSSSLALAAAAPSSSQGAPPPAPIPVGINLRPITAYDRAWVFADAMKMASDWQYEGEPRIPPARRTDGKGKPPAPSNEVPLDANGWPRPTPPRAALCDFFVGMRGRIPAGEYVVTWKGRGTVEFRGHVGILSQAPNRLVVNVDGVNGGQPGLRVANFDAADPLRDIHVWLPGLEDSCHAFHPVFLDRMRPFSVVRFYPWMRVYSTSGRWSERTTPHSGRQGGPEGVAIEHMVDLCNELSTDPWFCIPHSADDDYVRQFATLVRDGLRHDAKVYVEFSNETWNTDFVSGQWAREQGQLRGIPAMQVVGERAGRVFDIWHEVFGGQKGRIVRVAGVQLHNPGIATVMCRALNGRFDALAVGAYFGARADRDQVDRDSTAQELMTVARANLDSIILPRIAEHRALADGFTAELGRPIALLTYEGGQSIVARSPGGGLDVEATLACQSMPAMFDAYRALIEGAQARGVSLFVGYDFAGPRSSADTFSVLEHIQEPLSSAPKYRALVQGWESRGQ
jgi:hypothetical protein